jgi:phosphoribosylanthranilate isomerase
MFKHEVQVIKAFGVDKNFDFANLTLTSNNVDYFLFDTKTAGMAARAKHLIGSILNKYKLDVPFFLSGGLSLDNLEEIKR